MTATSAFSEILRGSRKVTQLEIVSAVQRKLLHADRLNQGPFPQYAPEALIPTDDVVMTTTPSEEVVPNYGKGLITYITADSGTDEIKSDNIPQAIEDLVRFPLGQQLYIRPTWREVQPRPGRLELPDYVKLIFDLAKKNNKRVGLRIQMSAPDYKHQPALPEQPFQRLGFELHEI